DDIGVVTVELQFRVNDGPMQIHPLTVTGLGTREAGGTTAFPLSGKVQAGDRFSCRLRTSDNRAIPEARLGPQSAFFPSADQWCVWQIVSQAAPVREREATAQRDAIDRAIRDLVGKLDRDRQAMAKLARNSGDQAKP